ncbi:MAG: EamA family transporter [Thermodesulfobacteriota bacterium]
MKETIKAYGAWAAVCLFWGTTYLAIRVGVASLPPALFAGIRFAIAGGLFLLYLKWKGLALPKRDDFRHIAIVGITLLVMANGLVVWAEQWVPSSLAALLVATLPFWVAGYEAFLPGAGGLGLRKVIGMVIGFGGLVVLFAPELKASFDVAYFKGVLALLFAPCCWAGGSIYSKYRPVRTHPLMAAAFQMMIAGAVLVLIGGVAGEFGRFAPSARGVAALAYLVVFGSILGYGAFVYSLAKLPATKHSMYAYVNPVIAVLLGWLVLDERLDWNVAFATTLVLAGVVLVKSARS